ncbi:hypothetical protein D3C81_1693200 [compost metagenome]
MIPMALPIRIPLLAISLRSIAPLAWAIRLSPPSINICTRRCGLASEVWAWAPIFWYCRRANIGFMFYLIAAKGLYTQGIDKASKNFRQKQKNPAGRKTLPGFCRLFDQSFF